MRFWAGSFRQSKPLLFPFILYLLSLVFCVRFFSSILSNCLFTSCYRYKFRFLFSTNNISHWIVTLCDNVWQKEILFSKCQSKSVCFQCIRSIIFIEWLKWCPLFYLHGWKIFSHCFYSCCFYFVRVVLKQHTSINHIEHVFYFAFLWTLRNNNLIDHKMTIIIIINVHHT